MGSSRALFSFVCLCVLAAALWAHDDMSNTHGLTLPQAVSVMELGRVNYD
jgi:hypothetical protein